MSTALDDIRKRALQNFHFFSVHCMGYQDADTPFHQELCQSRQAWHHEPITLHLEPRGHLKTSLLTISDSVWEIVHDHNIRIALFNAEYANGTRIIRETRRHFESNPRIRSLWPHLCVEKRSVHRGYQWTNLAFEVPGRTRVAGEATMTLVSVEGSAVSQHFDKLNYDDMLALAHVLTQEQRDKHWEWFLNSFQLRHSPKESRIVQEGTFWHHDDTYSRQIKKELEYRARNPGAKLLRVHKTSVYGQSGIPTWPERFSDEAIAQIREQLRRDGGNDYIFNCQYLLNPTPAEQAILRWDHVRKIEERDLPVPISYYASLFFRTDREEGRYDCILVVGVDTHGNLYQRRIYTGSFTPAQILNDLAVLSRAYNLRAVYVPQDVLSNTLVPAMDTVDDPRHARIPFEEVDRPKLARTARILALQPAIKAGHYHVVDGCPRLPDMKEEFDQMSCEGSKGHAVLLTCLADFARFAGRPHSPPPAYPLPGTYDEAFPWPEAIVGRRRYFSGNSA